MKQFRVIAALFILALSVGACNLPDGTSVSEEDIIRFAQETLQAQIDAGEVLPQGQAAPPADQPPADQVPADNGNGTATATEASSSAATPTITLTPDSGGATVSVTTATNCRSGPGVPHAINGALSPGQTANIIAQASVSNYVIIQNPGGGPDCWLWLQHATISGDISGLPVVTPPPTPTPTFTPTFTATLTLTQTPTTTIAPTMNWTGAWTSQANVGPFTMNLTQSGNSVSGSEPTGIISITGTVSSDGLTITGSYNTSAGASGTFTWAASASNYNQYTGNFVENVPGSLSVQWCGWRNGAVMPATCLGP